MSGTTTTVKHIVKGLLRPRFLFPACIATVLLLSTVYYHRLTDDYNDGYMFLDRYDSKRKAGPYFDDSTELSRKLMKAEKLYQKQVSMRKKIIEQNVDGAWLPRGGTMMPFWWYFQPAFNCPHEVERVGRYNDGGKWMCGMSVLESMTVEDKCVIYSLGVFDDSSWEKEMIDRTKCQVYAFDASVNGIAGDAAGSSNIHFFKYFVGGEDKVEDGYTWKTLKTIMKENGHTWIDVLKIDIEGNEYAALGAMMDQFDVLPFSQLQLEIHVNSNVEDKEKFMKFVNWWESLEAHHLRPFWSELNLVYSRLQKNLGLSEYSFINIDSKNRLLGVA
ncbi:hypothetical protein BGZ96_000319 [Linnemannia gamsii]|uniref:Methyltransferase domain-containing protein n=1 Tax=Linnemannia gamsii TaxID=64522 RepID=A0ABQ7JPE4_9FUNG|nr:hypothetical protein BGZ96_000319 [Linnemannia gamsii]